MINNKQKELCRNNKCTYRPQYCTTHICNEDRRFSKYYSISEPSAILYRENSVYSKSFMEYWIINALNKNYWRNF